MPPVYFFNSKKGITMEHNINPDQEVVSQALVDGLLAPYAAAQEQEAMVEADVYETHEVELTETNEVVSLPDFPAVFHIDELFKAFAKDEVSLDAIDSSLLLPKYDGREIYATNKYPCIRTDDSIETLSMEEKAIGFISKAVAVFGGFLVLSRNVEAVEWSQQVTLPTLVGDVHFSPSFFYQVTDNDGKVYGTAAAMHAIDLTEKGGPHSKIVALKRTQLKQLVYRTNQEAFGRIPEQELTEFINKLFTSPNVLWYALLPQLFMPLFRRVAALQKVDFSADSNYRFSTAQASISSQEEKNAETYYELLGIKMNRQMLLARLALNKLRTFVYTHPQVREYYAERRNQQRR